MKSKTMFFLFAFMVLIWGFSFPINKIGLSLTPAANFVEWRLLTALLSIFLLTLFTKNLALPKKEDIPLILAVGFFQIGLTLVLSTHGLSLVHAGKATFLIYTTPIWIILITGILHRKMTKLDLCGLILGTAGTLFLVAPWELDWSNFSSWSGEISLVLASLSWSIGIIYTRRLKWHSPPQKLLFWQVLVATIMTLLNGWANGVSLIPQTINLVLVGSLLYTGILGVTFGYWIMVTLSKHLLSAVISFGLLWVPIISLVLSHFFLNEPLNFHLIGSVLLIIAGILLHIYSEIKNRKKKCDLPP